MMDISTVIIDDDQANIDLYEVLINNNFPEIKILGTAVKEEEGLALLKRLDSSGIAILDIKLKNQTIFQLLEKLEEINFHIIFVSYYNNFSYEAFRFDAIDYIPSPVTQESFKGAISKALKSMTQLKSINIDVFKILHQAIFENQNESILINGHSRIEIIKIDKIQYIKSQGKYSIFTLDNEEIVSSKNLGVYQKALPQMTFCRVHKSFLVNIHKIKHIKKQDGYYCLMDNKSEIPISERNLKTLLNLLSFSKKSPLQLG